MAKNLQCPYDNCKFKSRFPAAMKVHQTKCHKNQPLPLGLAPLSNSEFPFACSYPGCSYRGKKQLYLSAHVSGCHNPDRPFFSCPWCVRTVKTQDGYKTHVKRHTGEGVHRCSICNFATPSTYTLRTHVQRHELDKKGLQFAKLPNKFKCDQCDYRSVSRARVIIHERIHSEDKPFKCSYFGCNFRCKWLGNLEQHEDRHDPALSTRFGCPICPKRFCMEYQVKRHVRTHTQEKTKECPDCDYRAATPIQVKRHQRRHHPADTPSDTATSSETNKIPKIATKDVMMETAEAKDNATACEKEPPKIKKNVASKTRSSRTKSAVDQVDCMRPARSARAAKTGKKLSTKGTGTRISDIDEKGTNARDDRYKCTVCGLATSSRYHLETHMKVHSEDKPFVCSFSSCDFRTRWESSLEQHTTRVHKSGPYSYTCPNSECDFRTDNTALANRHRYQHRFILKKSFGCPYCPKKYVSKPGLDAHMRSHTGVKPFKCSMCDYADSTRRKVEMHFHHNHGQEASENK